MHTCLRLTSGCGPGNGRTRRSLPQLRGLWQRLAGLQDLVPGHTMDPWAHAQQLLRLPSLRRCQQPHAQRLRTLDAANVRRRVQVCDWCLAHAIVAACSRRAQRCMLKRCRGDSSAPRATSLTCTSANSHGSYSGKRLRMSMSNACTHTLVTVPVGPGGPLLSDDGPRRGRPNPAHAASLQALRFALCVRGGRAATRYTQQAAFS
jgi:hypothetical protein